MEAILHELRDHAARLNAGRWDYIFSAIKRFPDDVLPDRSQVTMTVPFMRAYTELLVATCHRRGAHAMGGMAAFIPSRRDPAVDEVALAKVRDDNERNLMEDAATAEISRSQVWQWVRAGRFDRERVVEEPMPARVRVCCET